MKLKNKKTGEIDDFIFEVIKDRIDLYRRVGNSETKNIWHYNSLAELNEEWKDYEEPKEKHWYMTSWGEVWQYGDDPLHEEWRILLGNDFETKEEAEKAVEKLKAWKRLKDKGFKFIGVRGICNVIDFDMPKPYNHVAFDEYNANENELEFYNDLMLLFGGEE